MTIRNQYARITQVTHGCKGNTVTLVGNVDKDGLISWGDLAHGVSGLCITCKTLLPDSIHNIHE